MHLTRDHVGGVGGERARRQPDHGTEGEGLVRVRRGPRQPLVAGLVLLHYVQLEQSPLRLYRCALYNRISACPGTPNRTSRLMAQTVAMVLSHPLFRWRRAEVITAESSSARRP